MRLLPKKQPTPLYLFRDSENQKRAFTLLPEEKYAKKIVFTFFLLSIYRIGNSIPLSNIDNEAFQKSLQVLTTNNNFIQSLSILSNGRIVITPFTLGVLPYINASLIIDFLSQALPFLQQLQTEEGSEGKKKLQFYKKMVSFFFATLQSIGIVSYLKPYLFVNSLEAQFLLLLELVTGAFLVIWICNKIDAKGFGNGTSLIILLNIGTSILGKIIPLLFGSFHPSMLLELLEFYLFYIFIVASQCVEQHIPLVSAKQLFYLKNKEITLQDVSVSYLPIKLTQAGVFPIITALNILPFFSYFFKETLSNSILQQVLYYFLIVLFNYFYTIFFWDPQKISEELRKQSVSIPGLSPGQETQNFLSKSATFASFKGGVILCFLIFFFDSLKLFPGVILLRQINITSLIIGFGIVLDLIRLVKSKFISRVFFLFSKRFSSVK